MGGARKIVVVGGGAGGLELATLLGDRYRRRDDVEVTLVDRNHSHIWKPLLHEVAAGTLNSNDDELSYLAQSHWHHFRFRLGALEAIDRASRTITISGASDEEGREYLPRRQLPYDLLVIAIGSVTNDFAVPGVAGHCLFLDSREQADRFHRHLVHACYAANAADGALRRGQLQIAIAGAGATGVELAAELDHSVHTLVGFGLDQIDLGRDLKIHLIEGADRILPGLNEKISDSTREVLDEIGIEVHTGARIERADADGFQLADGRFIAAEIKVWAAGVRGADVAGGLDGLEVNRTGQLVVDECLATTRDPDIFAIGDCAHCVMPDGEKVPPRAQAAHQQAALLARNIHRRMQGREAEKFRYRDFGSLINLSERSAIGRLMGNVFGHETGSVSIEGRLARLAYLSLYKSHQVCVQGWIRTALLTLANFITRRSKPRLKLH